jgi:RNA-directed DNA polymerase
MCKRTRAGLATLRTREPLPVRQRHAGGITGGRGADECSRTGRTKEGLAQAVKPVVEGFCNERGRPLSAEKTRITHREGGFDLRAHHGRKDTGTCVVPSRKPPRAFLDKVRAIIRPHQHATAGQLIARRPPLMRGGAQDHGHRASTRTFSKVASAIANALWRWAKRRHPNKEGRRVAQQYFPTRGHRHGGLPGDTSATGQGKEQDRRKAARGPMRRHPKLKAVATRYDPDWEGYGAARLGGKRAATLQGRRRLR